jgi:hypothetical protein
MDAVTLGESRVAFLPVVRGLVREAERVRLAIEEAAPEAVAMTVGREDLDGLAAYDGANAEPANWEEEMYVVGLRQWGEVRKPPPCFVEAVHVARERGIAIRALDFNDEDYTDAFTATIGTLDLLWHTRLEKKAREHAFTATTPEEFVLEFDALVNDPEAYATLERAREEHIAKRIAKLAGKHRALLALVEYERAAAVRALLDDYRPKY